MELIRSGTIAFVKGRGMRTAVHKVSKKETGREATRMLGETRSAPRGRRLTLYSIALPVAAIALWLSGALPNQFVFPALLGCAAIGMMAVALQGTPAAAPVEGRRRLVAEAPPAERTRVLIVGASSSARRAALELEGSGQHEVVGFVADRRDAEAGGPCLLGGTDDIPMLVRRLDVQQVIVAEAPAWQRQLAEMSDGESRGAVGVHIVPGLYEARVGRLQFHRVRDLPLVNLAPVRPWLVYPVLKRCMDAAFAAVGLILTAPVIGLCALAIKLTSPGSVLFRQERVGRGGRSFTILKLRTMVVDAEKNTGPVLSAGTADARITPLGRVLRATRLDELPQLVNVLRGEMSLVGPRPERPCFVRRYETEIAGYRERHQVPPGLTGLAQVNAGYAIDAEMTLRYDLMYVYHRSLWLDLKIMLQTVVTVCRRSGQ
jgi:exopolysaccharide biosynthesis polyprenyl glycosylphosphotransferase